MENQINVLIGSLRVAIVEAGRLDKAKEHLRAAGVLQTAIDACKVPSSGKEDPAGLSELISLVRECAREKERQLRRDLLLQQYLA